MRGKIPRILSTRFTSTETPKSNQKATAIWGELAAFGLEREVIQWAVQPFIAPSVSALTFEQAQQSVEVNFGIQFLELLLQYFKGVPVVAFAGLPDMFLSRLGVKPAATCPWGAADDITPLRDALQYFVNAPWLGEIARIRSDDAISGSEKNRLLINLGGFVSEAGKKELKKKKENTVRRPTVHPVKRTSKRFVPEPLPFSTLTNIQHRPSTPPAAIKVALGEVLIKPRQNRKAVQEVKDFFAQCREKTSDAT